MYRLVFNGKEYRSPEEMPADVRQAFECICRQLPDANQNGIPDVFEAAPDGNIKFQASTFININGTQYRSLEEMPPEMRKHCQGMLTVLAGKALGGLLEGGVAAAKIEGTSVAPMPAGHEFQSGGPTIASPSSTSISFDKSPSVLDSSSLSDEPVPQSWRGAQFVLTLLCILVLAAIINGVVWIVRASL